eukprot:CAMPEP_0170211606 /NCGR_PEP_ID=MMETSP0116_2-20130129/5419_1 /TAXON_ID=400756 /ORGANISM="Durinskia baltica, Strain CSIRO CS-38" /LENGTH=114 /DNA_ID=CAMNT_0010462141 /DNA_START=77 /DNA_END=417 /DNA_ORIENTATION=+
MKRFNTECTSRDDFSKTFSSFTLASTHSGLMPNAAAGLLGCARLTVVGVVLAKSSPTGRRVNLKALSSPSGVRKVKVMEGSAALGTPAAAAEVSSGGSGSAFRGGATEWFDNAA